jgi:translation elongation factor EF-1alpha
MPKAKKAVKKPAKKTAKKITPKAAAKPEAVEGKLIGKITHYFSNIEVAVIDLTSPLKEGDTIRVVGGQETDFEQEVASMQIEHEEVKAGKKGDSVGLKIKEKVHEGYKVYKI